MPSSQIGTLLTESWNDLQQPDVLWQLATLVLCLGASWILARMLYRPAEGGGVWRIGRRGLNRLLFPLLGLALVLLARAALRQWHHVNLLSVAAPLLGSFAVIRIVIFTLRYALAPSGWLAAFERILALTVWGIVALYIVGVLPDLVDTLEGVTLAVGKQKLSLWLLLQGAATVLVTLLVSLWAGGLIEARLMRAQSLDPSLRLVFTRLAKALLMVLAVLVSLPLVGIDLTALSVFGGALGVGIGFGLQKLAANYVSGFTILLDRSIRLGNVITVDKYTGEVTRITTRYTVLRGMNNVEAIVPNEVLVGSVVQNEPYTSTKVRLAVDLQVGYGADLDRVMQILVEAARRHPRVLAEPPPRAFLLRFADSGIAFELELFVADVRKGTLDVLSELQLDIWREFQRAGIEIPRPQREVHVLGARPEA